MIQYLGWVGSFLVAALLAANWCLPAPVAPQSDVALDQKSAFEFIRIINGPSEWCWTARA
jgi:hypothetical protein